VEANQESQGREVMLKKTITYVDFNGEEVVEDFFFHLSKAELVELEMSYEGGLTEQIKRIAEAEDGKAIIAEFKKIILGAYGQRSPDGRRFIKNQTLRDEFESTEAYSTLFMELVTDAEKAAEFVRGVIPQDLAEEAAKVVAPVPDVVEETANVVEIPRKVTRAEMVAMSQEDLSKVNAQIAAGEAILID
jgi:hypothetical protein